MVSFTTIAQGIALVSILIMRSEAAPAVSGVDAKVISGNETFTVSPIEGTISLPAITFEELPPIIADRVVPVTNPEFIADLNSETRIIAENRQIFEANGGNLTRLERREVTNVASTGLTFTVPANAPPATFLASSTVTTATTAQITKFKLFSAIAATTYCDSVTISKQWTCTYCKKYVPDGKMIVAFETAKHKIGGIVLRSDLQKTIFVVFRGSSNLDNWITNLEFIRGSYTPVSGASAHIGFYNAYKEASTYFFPQFLAQHKAYPTYKVAVTGHSLGAAQAVLGAMDIYQRVATINKSNLSIYTGGCPRIGNDDFAYYVDGTKVPHYRSVHNRDIVPHVPPQALGYYHPGIEVWTKSATTGQLCSGIENDACSNSIVPFTSTEDHRTYYGMVNGACS
ncbi:hypothetical protein INT47_000594 [Mucor saturninus]|uniref:Fungal lipase-type domain-containing protein n=1 Tax=Mucor saturninus TaxID=64648 RepID=A0A8H7VDM1_9FUNG|nr:hypothetical protein INT47_000594 [Mucor saturninus]